MSCDRRRTNFQKQGLNLRWVMSPMPTVEFQVSLRTSSLPEDKLLTPLRSAVSGIMRRRIDTHHSRCPSGGKRYKR
jgi:hypothetical protein